MSFYLMFFGTVLGFSGATFFIFIMVYFGFTKKKYEDVLSRYLSSGLIMPDVYVVYSKCGFFTSLLVVGFFRKLLKNKTIRLGKNAVLPKSSYEYVQSLPESLKAWINRYYSMHMVAATLIAIGFILMLIDSLIS
ncbi:hypothetical protein OSR40_001475 [Serratia rubidaea]|uniref:hypothetical protein n=1 Tax=Serratia rubidaea TaxID=61652 RepID=UPI0023AE93D6|nr:hypothetical protein [Serratia rubidaea]MDK1702405.1 hypothetical protein [Serratia rubidaea]